MIEQVSKILNSKGYSNELIEFAINLLPEMVKLFGKEKTMIFLREYTLIPRARIGQNSGATYKKDKKIEYDWSSKSLHEALTLFIHEAAHAIGSLETDKDSFLMEGFEYREAFLNKFEEAVVSERQNEIEYGELNYTYVEINNYENGEEFHQNDFKTQPTQKYAINNVFYKNIQILLGNNRNLINKMMFADSLEEKNKICNNIIELLKDCLSEDAFLKLKDCINVFVLNYSYHGDKITLFEYIKRDENFNDLMTREKYKELLVKHFPKNIKYCVDRNLMDKNIFSAVDDLCELTIDVLYNRLLDAEYDTFSSIKESCEYFSKIYNNSERLSVKTIKLKNSLIDKLKMLISSLILEFNNVGFADEEIFEILTKIISRSDFKEVDLANIQINNNGIISVNVSDSQQYLIQKNPIYPEGTVQFDDVVIGDVQPIKYEIILKENNQKHAEKDENNYSKKS